MFKKSFKFLVFIAVLISAIPSYSQKWELGGMLGASNYNGDLARRLVLKESHIAGGVYFRYNFGKYVSLKPSLQFGTISGDDKNFEENKYRNLNFKSGIQELSTMMEINFKPFGSQVRTENFTPYLELGIAAFHFNPKTKFNGDWFALQDLHTEEQSYKLLQLSVPVGMGLKWSVNDNFTLGFEFVYRRTFTDYLDDVSKTYPNLTEHTKQYGSLSSALSDRSAEVEGVSEPLSSAGDMRGDPALKDWYVFSMFSFSYRFTPIICWPNKPSVIWDY